MLLRSFLSNLPDVEIHHPIDPTAEFYSIVVDNRLVKSGSIFFATRGVSVDAHRFIPDAVKRGAVAIVGMQPYQLLSEQGWAPPPTVPYLQVENSRHALAVAAATLENFPARQLSVIGITGTDGKTSTSSLIEAILVAASRDVQHPKGRVGIVTTVGARICGEETDTGYHVTTPDAPVIQHFLSQMNREDCCYAVIESTSHGLDQRRVDAIDYDIAAVTNITHEHLDYHGTRDAYVAAKARLFRKLYDVAAKPGRYDESNFWEKRCAILNADDEGSYAVLRGVLEEESAQHGFTVPVRSYAIEQAADVSATKIRYEPDRTQFTVRWWGGEFAVESRLIGEFNVYNLLCAIATTLTVGVEPAVIRAAIATFEGVIGRMERIRAGQNFLAVVDFAHTPVSLERALITLRPLLGNQPDGGAGRLIAVFGCAGLRDRAKRRLMGQVSGRLADFTVITAEDPRTEDLNDINREIAAGVQEYTTAERFVIVPDRSLAIQFAVDMAQPGDIVAAFGKGHERSMCFGETEYPWSDQQAMREAMIRKITIAV